MADLDTIDGQLDELRAVPDNLDELIARYGERDRTLERIDDVLAALAAGTRPRTVPPLGATPSSPPVFVPSSVPPGARMSSRPPRAKSQPAPAAEAAPQAKPPIDYDALFGPETVPPSVPSVQPLAAAPLALDLESESESPALELEAEPAPGAPQDEALALEPAAEAPAAADNAELDAVLASAPAPAPEPTPAPAEAKADDEDGFEMMVEEDDILEIDGDDLEMVEEDES